jgi:FAD-dependent urate hydroxylase
MPISEQRFYFFFDVPLPVGLEENRATLKDDLKGYFAGWADPVQRLIDALDPETTNRIEIHDVEPFDTFVKGRVALLGDSAHSTTPDIGQGGCSAMEDAVVLGMSFADTQDIESALQAYQSKRHERAKDLVLKARKRCDVTHGKNMKVTQAWYDELKQEQGDNIMAGLKETIIGGPLG